MTMETSTTMPAARPSARAIILSLLSSFGPLVVFYAVNWQFGLIPAIGASAAYSIGEVVLHVVRKQPISTLFKFTAVLTILFGVVDLVAQQSLLFKYEATMTNAATGVLFAGTLRGRGSLLQEYYEKSPLAGGKPATPARARLFRLLTILWAGHFLAKAVLYVWIAQHYSLEAGLAIRAIVGNVSLVAMLGVTVLVARLAKRSERAQPQP